MTAAGPESLAVEGVRWLLDQGQETPRGLVWTGRADDDEVDPLLYSGAAGIVVTLLEAHRHVGDDRYADAARRGARGIAAVVPDVAAC
jgi:hypothetical protein